MCKQILLKSKLLVLSIFQRHLQKRLGTCECEFDECSEYVFDRLTDECPLGNSGPTCALQSYIDNSDDIEELFDGDAPDDAVMLQIIYTPVKYQNLLNFKIIKRLSSFSEMYAYL